jgi:hypothetical protein
LSTHAVARKPRATLVALALVALVGCAPQGSGGGAPGDSSAATGRPADTAHASLADTLAHAMADTVGLTPALPGERRLLPVDEAPRVADFLAFRERLRAAVAARDTAALVAAIDLHVRISFGDEGGIADFRSQWALGAPDSPLWRELETVLGLGGSFRGDSIFTAPYVFSTWPDELDAFESVAIVARDVALHAAPRADADALARVSYAILALPGGGTAPREHAEGWLAVRAPDGRIGYVAMDFVRQPLDYRAIFSRKDGTWKLVIFVAGD